MVSQSIKDFLNNPTSVIHQAVLNPYISEEELNDLAVSLEESGFSGISTDLIKLPKIKKKLSKNCNSKIIALISFPFGDLPFMFKKQLSEWSISEGADELELVPNFYALKNGKNDIFAEEIADICELGKPIRVVLDVNNLSDSLLINSIESSIEAGALGIQIGNGFGNSISSKKIKEISTMVKNRCEIKAVGGIKNLIQVKELLEAGANIIGTTWGFQLLKDLKSREKT